MEEQEKAINEPSIPQAEEVQPAVSPNKGLIRAGIVFTALALLCALTELLSIPGVFFGVIATAIGFVGIKKASGDGSSKLKATIVLFLALGAIGGNVSQYYFHSINKKKDKETLESRKEEFYKDME